MLRIESKSAANAAAIVIEKGAYATANVGCGAPTGIDRLKDIYQGLIRIGSNVLAAGRDFQELGFRSSAERYTVRIKPMPNLPIIRLSISKEERENDEVFNLGPDYLAQDSNKIIPEPEVIDSIAELVRWAEIEAAGIRRPFLAKLAYELDQKHKYKDKKAA